LFGTKLTAFSSEGGEKDNFHHYHPGGSYQSRPETDKVKRNNHQQHAGASRDLSKAERNKQSAKTFTQSCPELKSRAFKKDAVDNGNALSTVTTNNVGQKYSMSQHTLQAHRSGDGARATGGEVCRDSGIDAAIAGTCADHAFRRSNRCEICFSEQVFDSDATSRCQQLAFDAFAQLQRCVDSAR